MKKKEFRWDNFEDVVGLLFNAHVNVKIECDYAGDKRTRQFDGYFEIDRGEFSEPIKIGIECKNYRSAVPIEKVEAFTTKINTCKINKGIMVSYNGFQEGAILQAKQASIELFEFRELKKEDLKDKEVLQIDLKLNGYMPNFRVSKMTRKIITPILTDEEKSEFNKAPLKLVKNQNDFLYNDKGVYMGSFLEFIDKIYIKNIATLNFDEKNTIKIDLDEENYYMRQEWKEKNILLKILNFDLIIEFIVNSTDLIIGSDKIQDWYLLKNITLNKSRLIPKFIASNIQKKYLEEKNNN